MPGLAYPYPRRAEIDWPAWWAAATLACRSEVPWSMTWSWDRCELRIRTIWEIYRAVLVGIAGGMYQVLTYRLVCLVGLAQCCRSAVHLLDHAGKVLAHLVQAIRELLSQFVSVGHVSQRDLAVMSSSKGRYSRLLTFLIGSLQGLSRAHLLGNHLIHFTLIPVQPCAELILLPFYRC